jgi:hypothetical protein
MTDIKKKQIIRCLKWLIAAILVYEAYSCTNTFLEIDFCLDTAHGVWDYDQKRCRQDCLKWTEREKCIPLDADCAMYTDERGCIPKAEVEAMKQKANKANSFENQPKK